MLRSLRDSKEYPKLKGSPSCDGAPGLQNPIQTCMLEPSAAGVCVEPSYLSPDTAFCMQRLAAR